MKKLDEGIRTSFLENYNALGERLFRDNFDILFFSYFAYFSYLPESELDKVLSNSALSYRICDNDPSELLLVEMPTCYIVSFRGVEWGRLEDFRTVLNFSSKTFYRFQAHRGFVRAVEKSAACVMDFASAASKPIFFTGHSMGAAMASLMSAKVEPEKIFMYGPPKFAKCGGHLEDKTVRVINGKDFVTRLPPFIYHHIGQPVKVPFGGNIFTAHSMKNYIKSINNYYETDLQRIPIRSPD